MEACIKLINIRSASRINGQQQEEMDWCRAECSYFCPLSVLSDGGDFHLLLIQSTLSIFKQDNALRRSIN